MVSMNKKVIVIVLGLIAPALLTYSWQNQVFAAKLLNRSVSVSTSTPSAIANHVFRFDIPSSSLLGSIEFEYCQNDPMIGTPCTPPVGFSASSAILSGQSGETGFSIHGSSTANRLVLTRVAAVSNPGQVQYDFSNLTNPSTPRQTIYVRMATFANDDGTGSRTDDGAVAFSTSGRLATQGFVPPYLRFCVGVSVTLDCLTVSGNYLNLGALSTQQTKSGVSQMAAFTNDESGYLIVLLGTTMTSGNNVIPAMSTPQASSVGASQFGVNLRANTLPNVGQDVGGAGSGAVQPDYSMPNLFKFSAGDTLAASSIPTESNRFTASYVVNISAGQPIGVYTTTITYVASATF